MIAIPVMQVRHKSVLMYGEMQKTGPIYKNQHRSFNMSQQRTKAYSGTITQGAKKRITKAVELLVQSAKAKWIYNPITRKMAYHRLSFVTLTIAAKDNIDARSAHKKLLEPFLQWMRRTLKVRTYIWKAELQERGQIHYHITTPSFVDWKLIRYKWNLLQEVNGYTKEYFQDHGNHNPNSTDIHSVRGIENLSSYLIKYLSKSEQNDKPINGKTWDCSVNLKSANYFKVYPDAYNQLFVSNCVQEGLATIVQTDHFRLYKFKEPSAEYVLSSEQYKAYTEHLQIIRGEEDS